MNVRQVPQIFSEQRRLRRAQRSAARLQRKAGLARFILDEIADDFIERLSFVRHEAKRPLVIGNFAHQLSAHLNRYSQNIADSHFLDPSQPFGQSDYDLIAITGQLDAVNDLPGALIHTRNALEPGGLAIASFIGGASFPKLRVAMLAADGDRPAARIHPMVDPRAAPQLLQRAGWKDPVVDSHTLTVRYSSIDTLINDLRDQGLTSVLKDAAPPLGKTARDRARAAFLEQADADGKVSETFEIVTLTGRRSLSGT